MTIQIRGFTPLFDSLLQDERYGVIGASVFGKYWRYWAYYGKASASQERYAKELGISGRTVRTYLAKLVEDGYLEVINPDAKGVTVQYVPTQKVIIVIGAEYGTPENISALPEEPRKNFPTTPEKFSYKESKRESINKEKVVFSDWMLSSQDFMKAWGEFEEHRREIKKKLTPLAANKIIKKLSAFDCQASIAALNKSIENGWTGVFPENIKPHGGNGNGHKSAPAQRIPRGV